MSVTLLTFQLLISLLNLAWINMQFIIVTLEVSHLEMSPLKDDKENIYDISVTLLTSHSEISPLNLVM